MPHEVVRSLQVVNLVNEGKTESMFRAILEPTLGLSYDAGDRRYRQLLAEWRRQLKASASDEAMQELYAPHLTDRDRKKAHRSRRFSPPAAELWSALFTLDCRGADANAIRKAALMDPDIHEMATAFVRGEREAFDAGTILKKARAVLKEAKENSTKRNPG